MAQMPPELLILKLWVDLAKWSQATFGHDLMRGPIGPLKHLVKEAKEALDNPTDRVEYADCLLLVLDASRRAGITLASLLDCAAAKLVTNGLREWPAPIADEAVEHVR